MVQQQLNILEELKDLTYDVNGGDGFILAGCYDVMKPTSENTITKALRKMGYDTKTDLCGHRFRTLACSALIESGTGLKWLDFKWATWKRITFALPIHKAKHLEQRRLMLQWWVGFIDANSNGMVRPFEFAKIALC